MLELPEAGSGQEGAGGAQRIGKARQEEEKAREGGKAKGQREVIN
jgi:hypothetical protein